MGVYIDIEMPKSCSRCFCMASCRLWKNIMHPEFNRHRNCLLISVPPHGRLIDADALRQDWLENGENDYVYDTNSFLYSLDDAPTVIPAEIISENEIKIIDTKGKSNYNPKRRFVIMTEEDKT